MLRPHLNKRNKLDKKYFDINFFMEIWVEYCSLCSSMDVAWNMRYFHSLDGFLSRHNTGSWRGLLYLLLGNSTLVLLLTFSYEWVPLGGNCNFFLGRLWDFLLIKTKNNKFSNHNLVPIENVVLSLYFIRLDFSVTLKLQTIVAGYQIIIVGNYSLSWSIGNLEMKKKLAVA